MMQDPSKFEQSSLEVKRDEFKREYERFLQHLKEMKLEHPSLSTNLLYDLHIRQLKESIDKFYDEISGDFIRPKSENPDCTEDWSRYYGIHGNHIPIPNNTNKAKGDKR